MWDPEPLDLAAMGRLDFGLSTNSAIPVSGLRGRPWRLAA